MAEDIRYPIGRFDMTTEATPLRVAEWINQIEDSTPFLRRTIEGLTDPQLDTPYRDGGWTPRQIIHHIADSDMNSYIRFKLAATEDQPVIKPYNETEWSRLTDARTAPVEYSLCLLEGLHPRWVTHLRSLTREQLDRCFIHPDAGPVRLGVNIGAYAWHTRHHAAHITGLRQRKGWL